MKFYFWVFFFFFQTIFAQDSTKVKWIVGLDSRNSFIRNQKAPIFGVKVGVKKQNFSIGIGYFFLNPPIKKEGTLTTLTNRKIQGNLELRFRYFAFWFDYVWFQNPKWEISTPTYFGIGNAELFFFPTNLAKIPPEKKKIALVETSILTTYRLHQFVGVGIGLGLRNTITENETVNQSFNSLIYKIRIKLHLGELYKKLKKSNKIQ